MEYPYPDTNARRITFERRGHMKRLFLLIFFLSMVTQARAEQPAYSDTNNFTGSYVMDLGNKAGGTLMVIQMPDNKLLFNLECNRGAPSYNSGETSGTIPVKHATAIFETTEFGGECKIRFEFQKNEVVISQTGTDADCGFGFGVHCDGKYRLKSRKRPNLPED